MATKRKANTALVHNPSRRLTIGGAKKVNPVRRKRRSSARGRRRNPIAVSSARRRNPVRRSNPATVQGLLVAAVMAGVGVSIFDVIAQRFVPASSGVVRAGVKLGGAWLFQSNLGSKVPVLGKYKNDIALVLAVSGVVDLMKLYVFPVVASTAASFGLMAGPPVIQIGAGDETTGNIYGNAHNPAWIG